ncbi:hypothetical protein [Streptomyces sp. NPDC003015]
MQEACVGGTFGPNEEDREISPADGRARPRAAKRGAARETSHRRRNHTAGWTLALLAVLTAGFGRCAPVGWAVRRASGANSGERAGERWQHPDR